MPTYPPSVERWRALVKRYFREEDIDKALYVINGESGGNPTIAGDNGASIGLFQMNRSGGLGTGHSVSELNDPETNIRLAAQAVYGGSGWGPWGEGTTYQGQRFGALGNNPYGGRAGAANAGGALGEREGEAVVDWRERFGLDAAEPEQKTKLYGDLASRLRQTLEALTAEMPDPSDYEAFTIWTNEVNAVGAAYKQFSQAADNLWELPDGTVIPLSDVDAPTRAAIDRHNAQIADKVTRDYQIKGFEMLGTAADRTNDALHADFDNRVTKQTRALAYDNTNLQRARDQVDRFLKGKAESSTRAKTIADTQLQASAHGTTGGKTSFTPRDRGGAMMGIAGFLGMDVDQPHIRYPGYATIDPEGTMNRLDEQFGVTGAVPGDPPALTTVPGAEGPPPQFVGGPVAPTLIGPTGGGGGSMGVPSAQTQPMMGVPPQRQIGVTPQPTIYDPTRFMGVY